MFLNSISIHNKVDYSLSYLHIVLYVKDLLIHGLFPFPLYCVAKKIMKYIFV